MGLHKYSPSTNTVVEVDSFAMAKVYPQPPTCCSYSSSKKETLTIWMKSLVCHGNGCTVFNSKGEIIYRIDNYGEKRSREVYLMDLHGKVLFTLRKKLRIFRRWDGYRCNNGSTQKPCFRVRKTFKMLNGNSACQVTMGSSCYRIVELAGKSTFQIVNNDSEIIAEVKQKRSSSGVVFGDDVLNLAVEADVDHSFIMAIVAVYGLINHTM